MKKAFKFIVVIAAIVLLLPGLALAGKDEIMFPDVWGIELPIPEHFGGECSIYYMYYTKDNDIYIHYGKNTSDPFDPVIVTEIYVYSVAQKANTKKWIFKREDVFIKNVKEDDFISVHVKDKIVRLKTKWDNPNILKYVTTSSNLDVGFDLFEPGYCSAAIYSGLAIKRKSDGYARKKCFVYVAPSKISVPLRENCRYPPDLSDAKIHTSTPHLKGLFALNDGTVLLTFFDCPFVIRFDKNFESPFFDDNSNWFLVNTNKAMQIQKMAYEKAYKHHMATREGSLPELMDEIITDYFINNMSGGKDVQIR